MENCVNLLIFCLLLTVTITNSHWCIKSDDGQNCWIRYQWLNNFYDSVEICGQLENGKLTRGGKYANSGQLLTWMAIRRPANSAQWQYLNGDPLPDPSSKPWKNPDDATATTPYEVCSALSVNEQNIDQWLVKNWTETMPDVLCYRSYHDDCFFWKFSFGENECKWVDEWCYNSFTTFHEGDGNPNLACDLLESTDTICSDDQCTNCKLTAWSQWSHKDCSSRCVNGEAVTRTRSVIAEATGQRPCSEYPLNDTKPCRIACPEVTEEGMELSLWAAIVIAATAVFIAMGIIMIIFMVLNRKRLVKAIEKPSSWKQTKEQRKIGSTGISKDSLKKDKTGGKSVRSMKARSNKQMGSRSLQASLRHDCSKRAKDSSYHPSKPGSPALSQKDKTKELIRPKSRENYENILQDS